MAVRGVSVPCTTPSGAGSVRISRSHSSSLAPAGMSRWKAYMSTGSRAHVSGSPCTVKRGAASEVAGPAGLCRPGSHFGYTSVSAPGVTGMRKCAFMMPRGASRTSTATLPISVPAERARPAASRPTAHRHAPRASTPQRNALRLRNIARARTTVRLGNTGWEVCMRRLSSDNSRPTGRTSPPPPADPERDCSWCRRRWRC